MTHDDGAPAGDVEDLVDRTATPRLLVRLGADGADPDQVLDTPADLDGIHHLAGWLQRHAGLRVVSAEVIP